MRELGKIITRKTDLTDAQVEQKYKFPAIIILHDNSDKILKITHYQKNGTKTIYDFSLSASKDFVTQSIADAIAGLQDNTLEFPTFADFPANGEVGKVYIDLEGDKIYIWDSISEQYISQSWDYYIIQQLQTNIASAQMAVQNLQNSKLDKPTSSGYYVIGKNPTTDAVEYSAIALVPGQIPRWFANSFQGSVIYEVNGKIGISKTNPSEALEVNGRTKSDGQVFNETTSAILPKEIKFKDGNFVGAKEDGIAHKFLMEGDVQNNIKKNAQSGNINYCGYAPFGSTESASVWTVTKITVAANGTITKQIFTNVTWSSVPF